jgi:predicted RNA-binding Zn-ribbon protein involved in translation (DUF1610 family)
VLITFTVGPNAVPWSCPACGIAIRHSDAESMPRVGAYYRCHICRLELVLDAVTRKLTVAPIEDAPGEKKTR